MSKQKFKVGDHVVITGGDIMSIGKKGVLCEMDDSTIPFLVLLDNGETLWGCEKIWCTEVKHVRVEHPVIVITSDGKTTTATMRYGKKVLKTATATCSDKDTFDFDEGARAAFERLQGRDPFPKEKKPERPGKLVCVKGGCGGYLKAGKVYDVEWRSGGGVFDIVGEVYQFSGEYVDGKYTAPSRYGTAVFIPLVED